LLAILLYWIVFLNGVVEWRPILAEPPANSPAAVAGVRSGDLVIRVDGEPVTTWAAFQWHLLQALGHEHEMSIAVAPTRLGQRVEGAPEQGLLISLPKGESLSPDLLASLGLSLAMPDFQPVIGVVQPDSAAMASGLEAGDRIERINGLPVAYWSEVVRAIRTHPDQEMAIQIQRKGQMQAMTLTPRAVDEPVRGAGQVSQGGAVQRIGKAGLGPVQDAATLEPYRVRQNLDPFAALGAAGFETYDKSRFTLVMLGQMLTGKASLENLSGPVTIATAAGQTARIGPEAFLRFLAIVSLSLAVINLLPLPLLDGGHLMYYLVEILTGKPVSAERQAFLQRFGVVLLGFLMFIALFNDLQRLFNW